MRYQGSRFTPEPGLPDFFLKFLKQYDFVVQWMMSFNENRFNFKEDVRSYSITVGITHGVPNRIPHPLGYIPSAVLDVAGRVETLNRTGATSSDVTVVPKLLSTTLVNPPIGRLVKELEVFDPTLFRERDHVNLGGQVRQIRSIRGNVFTLDESVLCGKVYSLSLATETVQLLMY